MRHDFGEAWSPPSLTLMRTALWFGTGLILSAIAGFMPGLTREGALLGVFPVTTTSHLLHLLTGLTGLVAGFTSLAAARVYLRWMGSMYGGLALLALLFGQLGTIFPSSPVGFLYAGIAATALYHGFGERLFGSSSRLVLYGGSSRRSDSPLDAGALR